MGHLLGQRAQYHAPKQMWHFKILVGLFACSSQLIHLMWFDLGRGGGWNLNWPFMLEILELDLIGMVFMWRQKDSGIETSKGINVNSLTELDN